MIDGQRVCHETVWLVILMKCLLKVETVTIQDPIYDLYGLNMTLRHDT